MVDPIFQYFPFAFFTDKINPNSTPVSAFISSVCLRILGSSLDSRSHAVYSPKLQISNSGFNLGIHENNLDLYLNANIGFLQDKENRIKKDAG